MTRRILAVRLDNDGDVLLTGPAVRALAADGAVVDLLVAPSGLAAAHLLPQVGDVMLFDPPWSGFDSPPPIPMPWRPSSRSCVSGATTRR